VFIAGNHDFFFEQASEEQVRNIIPPGVTYLEDSAVEIEGYRIWGSPITPSFYDWAFNRERGADIRAGWELIPAETDILIVHGPPYSILDKTYRGAPVGCRDLLGRVSEIEPAVFICGHIHEAYGMLRSKETTFINCSQVNLAYEIANPPVVIDLGLKNRDE
jgi:Icc-related predicted phosphoesterase